MKSACFARQGLVAMLVVASSLGHAGTSHRSEGLVQPAWPADGTRSASLDEGPSRPSARAASPSEHAASSVRVSDVSPLPKTLSEPVTEPPTLLILLAALVVVVFVTSRRRRDDS